MTGGRLRILDRAVFLCGGLILAAVFIGFARANIAADAIDYYGMLQWVTPAAEKPIVGNLHFAKQRSPGYSLTALLPYYVLSHAVEPLVSTELVTEYPPPPPGTLPTVPPPPPPQSEVKLPPPPSPSKGSEFMFLPPRPLLVREVPFRDFFIPQEGSWYQWKLTLSLALTSFIFLMLGYVASGRMLALRFPEAPGYALVPAVVFTSPIFLVNIVHNPLYATFTVYGVSALFAVYFLAGSTSRNTRELLLAGALLGYLVLLRLEVAVLAGVLTLLLFVYRKWKMLFCLVVGASWAAVAWALYNWVAFGKLFNFAILAGDINKLVFRPGYIFDSLFHPASSVLVWTPALLPGLVGLALSRTLPLRFLAIAAVALIGLYVLRVPIMYDNAGGPPIMIGGIPVGAPPTMDAMRELIRADNNRYVIVLLPFLTLGIRELFERFRPAANSSRPNSSHDV